MQISLRQNLCLKRINKTHATREEEKSAKDKLAWLKFSLVLKKEISKANLEKVNLRTLIHIMNNLLHKIMCTEL